MRIAGMKRGRPPHRVTVKQIARAVRKYRAGETLAAVAAWLDCSPSTARRILADAGCLTRPPARIEFDPGTVAEAVHRYQTVSTLDDVATYLGVDRGVARRILVDAGVQIRPKFERPPQILRGSLELSEKK